MLSNRVLSKAPSWMQPREKIRRCSQIVQRTKRESNCAWTNWQHNDVILVILCMDCCHGFTTIKIVGIWCEGLLQMSLRANKHQVSRWKQSWKNTQSCCTTSVQLLLVEEHTLQSIVHRYQVFDYTSVIIVTGLKVMISIERRLNKKCSGIMQHLAYIGTDLHVVIVRQNLVPLHFKV